LSADAPKNTVLYLDKPLKAHGLLQAIARVNRVEDDKEYGYIIDYAGVLGELDPALKTYSALADFEAEDIQGVITDNLAEIEKLPQRHHQLWDLFKESATSSTKRHLTVTWRTRSAAKTFMNAWRALPEPLQSPFPQQAG
jgi:type I site-specific restriction-modification system R (restriction) subunit